MRRVLLFPLLVVGSPWIIWLSLGALAEYGFGELCYMGESMSNTHVNGSALVAEGITCVVP